MIKIIRTRQGVTMTYNAQAVVAQVRADGKAAGMLITTADAVGETTGQSQLDPIDPMIEQTEATKGIRAETTLADVGNHSGRRLEECAHRGQQVLMPESQERAKDRFTYDEPSDNFRRPLSYTLRFADDRPGRRTTLRAHSSLLRGRVPGFSFLTDVYEEQAP